MILSLCDRFHCLPSQLGQEDADLLRLIRLEALAFPERYQERPPTEGW